MPIDASIISTPNLAVLTGRRSMESLGELIAVGAGLAVISALIVARTPSRRLIWVMLLWLQAPAILMAGMMALGALLNPRHDEPLSQAIFGVMLIGVFVAVPWMLVCAAGYAAGFAWRRKHPLPDVPQPPPAERARLPLAERFAAWRVALMILIGAVAAIAGLTWFSMETGIDPPSVGTIPHIPRFPR